MKETLKKFSYYQKQFLGGIKIEIIEWKQDLEKIYDLLDFIYKDITAKKVYIINAVNGSIILEQKVTESKRKSSKYLKQMRDKWGPANVRCEYIRIT